MHVNTHYGKAFAITLVTSLLFFFEFGLSSIFNALQPHIALALSLSPTVLGFISSVFFYIEVILLIPAGLLLDRYSPKKIILIMLLVSILGVVLTALAHNMVMLFLARVLYYKDFIAKFGQSVYLQYMELFGDSEQFKMKAVAKLHATFCILLF